MHDDRDLKMVIQRTEFETRADALFERLRAPLSRVMAQANWTNDDVHRIEVIGGATRVPRVKEIAKEFFGRAQLDGAINGMFPRRGGNGGLAGIQFRSRSRCGCACACEGG